MGQIRWESCAPQILQKPGPRIGPATLGGPLGNLHQVRRLDVGQADKESEFDQFRRLRVERQLGYKQAKYVERIEAVDDLSKLYGGKGGYWEDGAGYEWYAGI